MIFVTWEFVFEKMHILLQESVVRMGEKRYQNNLNAMHGYRYTWSMQCNAFTMLQTFILLLTHPLFMCSRWFKLWSLFDYWNLYTTCYRYDAVLLTPSRDGQPTILQFFIPTQFPKEFSTTYHELPTLNPKTTFFPKWPSHGKIRISQSFRDITLIQKRKYRKKSLVFCKKFLW